MTIEKRDITTVTKGIVCHQVNCKDRIGAGVSGAIIRKWPQVRDDYHRYCADIPDPRARFGVSLFTNISNDLDVVSLFTQFNYGNAAKTGYKYTDENALIRLVRSICDMYPDRTVYVPYGIGCGLAGGDWERVSQGITHNANLVVCKPD